MNTPLKTQANCHWPKPAFSVTLFLIALLSLISANSSHAASASWNGSVDSLWMNDLDWSVAPAPSLLDTATFDNGGNGNTTIDLTGGVTNGSVVFDTANAAAYTIGAGVVGSQTLTLLSSNGIALTSTVASNQLFNANLALPTNGLFSIVNNSAASTLTIAGGISTTTTNIKILNVDGIGTNIISGAITSGTGTVNLIKTNSGTLILSGGAAFSGNGVNAYLPGSTLMPADLREGATIITGGTYTNNGEFTIGGVSFATNGGPGFNVSLTINGGSLGIGTWLSLGRGNGTGAVSSDLIVNSNAAIITGNLSAGYNGSSTTAYNTNAPKGSLTLNNNATLTITGNGGLNFAESPASSMTMNLNNSAQFIAAGTAQKHLGMWGSGTVNLNDSSVMKLGNGVVNVGYRNGTGVVNVASSAQLSVANDFRVGGSDGSGTGINGHGTVNLNSGTINVSSLTIARGNNNQNGVSGEVNINGGTFTATNDVVVAYAGTGHGKLNVNGGTFNVGTTATKWLVVPYWDTTTAEVDITNGALNLNSGSAIRFSRGNTGTAGTPNIINQEGGAVTFYSDFATTAAGGAGVLDMQYSGASTITNIYNLDGGVLSVPQVASTLATATRFFNFNGGTLKATAAGANFFNLGSGNAFANVRNGGAVIDNGGYNITFVSPLIHSMISGDNAIDGGLTLLGTGSVTLTTGNSYNGPTKVFGGTLALSAAIFPANDLVLSNGTVSIDVTAGSLNANNVTLDDNATLGLGYGNLTANPTVPGLNINGSLAAAGTNLTIAVSGLGLRPGTFTLIKYTGAALPNLNNFNLVLPPGVVAALVNNTGNDSIDLQVSTSPNNLTWEGVGGTAWDVNLTPNWRDGNNTETIYQQYTNGSFIVGDAVTFDDTLTNDFVNPQPTNINLTTAIYSFPIVVNSTLPYSFGGSGTIAGSGNLTLTNTGSLFIGTSNSYSGGTFVGGGTLLITNDSALGAASSALTLGGGTFQNVANLTNSRPTVVTASSLVDVPTNLTFQTAGAVTGSGGLTKTDDGALILTGSNGLTGTLTVNQGTLTTSGTNVLAAVPLVGNSAGFNGVLKIAGGVFQDTFTPAQVYNTSLTVGNVANAAGDLILSGGTVTIPKQLTIGSAGYGAVDMTGGTMTIGGFIAMGATPEGAVINQTGGTINLTNTAATIGYAVTTSYGVMNLGGSAVFNALNNGIWPGEVGNGTLNVSGSAALTITNEGVHLGRANAAAVGTVNLNGGTITAAFITNGLGSGIFNFNGGALKANAGGTFTKGVANSTAFFDYNGGAIIDSGANNITFTRPIQSATGYGVASIAVTPGTSAGYISTPIVLISGGSGSNATATATVAGGQVTAVSVTCPGSGYAPSDSLFVSFVGGGATPTAPTVGTITFAANGTGGLLKRGTGTLSLMGSNTYSGSTLVSTGIVLVTPAHQVTGPVGVTNNAAFGVILNTNGFATVGDLTLGSSATGTNFLSFVFNTPASPTVAPLHVGAVTLNGTNVVRLGGQLTVGTFPLMKYTGAVSGTGIFATNAIGAQGVVATVSNDVADSTVFVTVSSVGSGITWAGTNSAAGQTNVWGLNAITNWLSDATPTIYTETVPPGDAVNFTDTGSGVVLLSNTVSPLSLNISNNTVNYAFSGTGKISGTTGITKLGSGTATLSLTNNDYAGGTVISSGTLKLGSTTAIPSGAGKGSVSIDTNGTVDLAGFSETLNGLSGYGSVSNSGTAVSTLTIGSDGTGGNWSGNMTPGSSGITLLKVGNGTLVLSGTNTLTGQSQINGGTTMLTNNAVVSSTEFWIGQNVTTGAVVVATGAALNTTSWVVVGRNNVAANGTLIVNGGTVQKTGANNIVIGSLGATGTLIVNSGQVLNNGNLWIGENATANAYVYLNGGLLQASQVRANGTSTTTSDLFLNGGTLQASANSTAFITNVTAAIQDGGAIIDDGGFVISIPSSQSLANDGSSTAGLLKKGAGTLYLDNANTYLGATVVTNGTLAGIGSIAAPVAITTNGTLGAGDAGAIGTLTINSSVTIEGKAQFRVSKTGGILTNDLVTGIASATYGGTLVVSNATTDATPLQVGDTFTLFSASSHHGNFTNILGSAGPGLAYSFTNGVLSVVQGYATNPTNITVTASGGTLNLSWPADHSGWILQEETNTLSPSNWFDVPGSGAITSTNIVVDPAVPAAFFRLRSPN
jgi:autotransporter-associated beta strand protein